MPTLEPDSIKFYLGWAKAGFRQAIFGSHFLRYNPVSVGKSHHISIMQKVGHVGGIIETDGKGRVVISKTVRDQLSLDSESKLALNIEDDRTILSVVAEIGNEQAKPIESSSQDLELSLRNGGS